MLQEKLSNDLPISVHEVTDSALFVRVCDSWSRSSVSPEIRAGIFGDLIEFADGRGISLDLGAVKRLDDTLVGCLGILAGRRPQNPTVLTGMSRSIETHLVRTGLLEYLSTGETDADQETNPQSASGRMVDGELLSRVAQRGSSFETCVIKRPDSFVAEKVREAALSIEVSLDNIRAKCVFAVLQDDSARSIKFIAEIEDLLQRAKRSFLNVELDLSRVRHLGSRSVGALMDGAKSLAGSGLSLVISSDIQPNIRQKLRDMRFEELVGELLERS